MCKRVRDAITVIEITSLRQAADAAVKKITREFSRARLYGSWATAEAHVPGDSSRVLPLASESDVDLISDEWWPQYVTATLQEKIVRTLEELGLKLDHVSFRTESELREAPHEWEFSAARPFQLSISPSRFLAFWSLVAGTETCLRCNHALGASFQPKLSYGISKWFFCMVKNVALLRRTRLHSYSEAAQWAVGMLPNARACIDAAYQVKLGNISSLTVSEGTILADTTSDLTRSWDADPKERDALELVRVSLIDSLRAQKVLPHEEFLRYAGDLASNGRLRGIVAYQERKLLNVSANAG
jgi:hypothetical protein